MTGLLVVLIPLLLLLFMFAMQRIESSLLSTPVPDAGTLSTPTQSTGNTLPTESVQTTGTQSEVEAA